MTYIVFVGLLLYPRGHVPFSIPEHNDWVVRIESRSSYIVDLYDFPPAIHKAGVILLAYITPLYHISIIYFY